MLRCRRESRYLAREEPKAGPLPELRADGPDHWAVCEVKGELAEQLNDLLKKGEMAKEAERLLKGSGRVSEVLGRNDLSLPARAEWQVASGAVYREKPSFDVSQPSFAQTSAVYGAAMNGT